MRQPSQLLYANPAGLLAVCLLLVFATRPSWAAPQTLDERLSQQDPGQLAKQALEKGDAVRGAMVYYNPVNTCITCHEPSSAAASTPSLGPALEIFNRDATPEHVVKSLLHPSETIPDEYATETIFTLDGKQVSGLIVKSEDGKFLDVLDPQQIKEPVRIAVDDIDERKVNTVSAMPEGLMGALPNEQAFLDLVAYLIELKKDGEVAKRKLRPPESFFAVAPLPDYEAHVDHAGLIRGWNEGTLVKGEATYARYCARCHGDSQQEGSMPAALKFGKGAFKHGTDPFAMYQTLTHGNGLMVAQRWMVPQQKYEVIHYIREHFLRKKNKGQWFEVTDDYLAKLPAGDTRGPDPVISEPWSDMDYGNFLFNTVEVGKTGNNIAYKGIALRLDDGPGGVSQGRHWMMYEHDTMRVAAAWSGRGFIDYNGIHFNDRHGIHPRVVGSVAFQNDHLPGWADPQTHSFEDDPRVVGRDDKKYGPLPQSWLKYRGLYRFGDQAILNYTVGDSDVLELPSLSFVEQTPVFRRTLNIGPRNKPLLVKLASVDGLERIASTNANSAYFAGKQTTNQTNRQFDGSSYLTGSKTYDWHQPVTVVARIKTEKDGTIICQTENQDNWVPGGTSLFVRDGRLVFDIGWIGAVTSRKPIDDGRWHHVALVWKPDEERAELYIDGKRDRIGELEPGEEYDNPIVRIGYTAEDFPGTSKLDGEISQLTIWQTALTPSDISGLHKKEGQRSRELNQASVGSWNFAPREKNPLTDRSKNKNDLKRITGGALSLPGSSQSLWCHVRGLDAEWSIAQGSLCLKIPAGKDPLAFSISMGNLPPANKPEKAGFEVAIQAVVELQRDANDVDLKKMTLGGAPRYPDVLTSKIRTLPETKNTAFEVDYLLQPESNPWDCRMRFTGIDFADENTAFVSAWDGSVWKVQGFINGETLTWRRIAHGLFQPLGIRIVNDQILVTCRDQIVMLHDVNSDGYTDYYQAFNSDHQVTEHFHEFAMGLQSDDEGNLYYAKSARHAKNALVPHHGTLLKVSADGRHTKILATGFRAANGVCLNPDQTFYVTDQEGHWNPKNRINWVKEGGFYGNMMGYHDVADQSDKAMIEPMCWITNSFDRSPGELLWVPNNCWGDLGGSLLNMSYGMGQVFVVPHEKVGSGDDELLQGGMCSLPIPLFPTGVMRGRFHTDGHLYCCGMYAWAGNQQKPGGLYRIRKTINPAWLPTDLKASKNQITIELSDPLSSDFTPTVKDFQVKVWDIKRTANYGSPHLNERELKIDSVQLIDNRRTIQLKAAGLESVRCMEIKCFMKDADGSEFTRVIHNTIHVLGDE